MRKLLLLMFYPSGHLSWNINWLDLFRAFPADTFAVG